MPKERFRKDNCPKCNDLKDKRSNMCRKCQMKYNHPRLGTGKWSLSKNGYIVMSKMYKHRNIIEQSLGIKLDTDEYVHHINGDKTDNRIENLLVMKNCEHQSYHLTSEKAKKMSILGHKARWGYVE